MRQDARNFVLFAVGAAVATTLREKGLVVAVSAAVAVGLVGWYVTDKMFDLVERNNGAQA